MRAVDAVLRVASQGSAQGADVRVAVQAGQGNSRCLVLVTSSTSTLLVMGRRGLPRLVKHVMAPSGCDLVAVRR